MLKPAGRSMKVKGVGGVQLVANQTGYLQVFLGYTQMKIQRQTGCVLRMWKISTMPRMIKAKISQYTFMREICVLQKRQALHSKFC
jgi:hypothetical protein